MKKLLFTTSFGVVGLLCASSCFSSRVRADVKLPALFGSNMVLQRRQTIPVWGWASPGERVTVTLGTDQASAQADENGHWKAALMPREAAEKLKMTVEGPNKIVFDNVAVGEVWLASGQSNMEYSVTGWPDGSARFAAEEIPAAKYPNIRLFTVGKAARATPQSDISGNWSPVTPDSVKYFSGVAYYFGRELHQKLDVPVGLVLSVWGGTPAEAWTSQEKLASLKGVNTGLDDWQKGEVKKQQEAFEAAKKKYETETLPQWQAAVDAAKAENKPAPARPGEPVLEESPFNASRLYNGMIAPLIPFSMRGVIWYQGESNSGRSPQYNTLFPGLISDWRGRWGQGDFPFYFVQLANYQRPQQNPVEIGGWPSLREAQARTQSLPNTGMASAVDLHDADNPDDIHPKNKRDVGHRLALIALAKTYEKGGEYSGPVFEGMSTLGNQVRLRFGHAEGLQMRGDALKGFALSGEDGKWQWASAKIDGKTVVLSSPGVTKPTKVRYGWAGNTIGNLYNSAGLPATPFRTDTEGEY